MFGRKVHLCMLYFLYVIILPCVLSQEVLTGHGRFTGADNCGDFDDTFPDECGQDEDNPCFVKSNQLKCGEHAIMRIQLRGCPPTSSYPCPMTAIDVHIENVAFPTADDLKPDNILVHQHFAKYFLERHTVCVDPNIPTDPYFRLESCNPNHETRTVLETEFHNALPEIFASRTFFTLVKEPEPPIVTDVMVALTVGQESGGCSATVNDVLTLGQVTGYCGLDKYNPCPAIASSDNVAVTDCGALREVTWGVGPTEVTMYMRIFDLQTQTSEYRTTYASLINSIDHKFYSACETSAGIVTYQDEEYSHIACSDGFLADGTTMAYNTLFKRTMSSLFPKDMEVTFRSAEPADEPDSALPVYDIKPLAPKIRYVPFEVPPAVNCGFITRMDVLGLCGSKSDPCPILSNDDNWVCGDSRVAAIDIPICGDPGQKENAFNIVKYVRKIGEDPSMNNESLTIFYALNDVYNNLLSSVCLWGDDICIPKWDKLNGKMCPGEYKDILKNEIDSSLLKDLNYYMSRNMKIVKEFSEVANCVQKAEYPAEFIPITPSIVTNESCSSFPISDEVAECGDPHFPCPLLMYDMDLEECGQIKVINISIPGCEPDENGLAACPPYEIKKYYQVYDSKKTADYTFGYFNFPTDVTVMCEANEGISVFVKTTDQLCPEEYTAHIETAIPKKLMQFIVEKKLKMNVVDPAEVCMEPRTDEESYSIFSVFRAGTMSSLCHDLTISDAEANGYCGDSASNPCPVYSRTADIDSCNEVRVMMLDSCGDRADCTEYYNIEFYVYIFDTASPLTDSTFSFAELNINYPGLRRIFETKTELICIPESDNLLTTDISTCFKQAGDCLLDSHNASTYQDAIDDATGSTVFHEIVYQLLDPTTNVIPPPLPEPCSDAFIGTFEFRYFIHGRESSLCPIEIISHADSRGLCGDSVSNPCPLLVHDLDPEKCSQVVKLTFTLPMCNEDIGEPLCQRKTVSSYYRYFDSVEPNSPPNTNVDYAIEFISLTRKFESLFAGTCLKTTRWYGLVDGLCHPTFIETRKLHISDFFVANSVFANYLRFGLAVTFGDIDMVTYVEPSPVIPCTNDVERQVAEYRHIPAYAMSHKCIEMPATWSAQSMGYCGDTVETACPIWMEMEEAELCGKVYKLSFYVRKCDPMNSQCSKSVLELYVKVYDAPPNTYPSAPISLGYESIQRITHKKISSLCTDNGVDEVFDFDRWYGAPRLNCGLRFNKLVDAGRVLDVSINIVDRLLIPTMENFLTSDVDPCEIPLM